MRAAALMQASDKLYYFGLVGFSLVEFYKF